MTATFYTIATDIGNAKEANAIALGLPRKFVALAVGDGGGDNAPIPTPKPNQKALLGEWRRAPLNSLEPDPKNPSQLIAEQIIPANEGGKWIREMALIDEDGDLCYISNAPPTYKPLLPEGSGKTQGLRMVIIVSNVANVELKIDPSVVLATREYADKAITVAMKAHTDAADPHPQYAMKNVTVTARSQIIKDTDLDTVTTAGVYAYAHTDGNNANAPEWAPKSGVMIVSATYNGVTQVIHDLATSEISSRAHLGNGEWSPWARQAVRGDTLSAYGITNAYTKVEADAMFAPGQAVFETSGVFTPVREDNWVTGTGGGGGGGAGGQDTNSMAIPGGGGGAGQWVYRKLVKLPVGIPVAVTIGKGGKGAKTTLVKVSQPLPGGEAGGITSLGTYLSLSGGGPGLGGFTGSGNVGGAGGFGWPGGGSGEYSASSVTQLARGGHGGNGFFGSGGPAVHGYQPTKATGPGSGGAGGSLYYRDGTDSNGGDGADGILIIEW